MNDAAQIARNDAKGDAAVLAALEALLRGSRRLAVLTLAGNPLGDRGMKLVLEAAAVRAAASLTELDISGTGCGVAASGALTSLVRDGTMLRRLGASDLKLPPQYWAERFLPALVAAGSDLVALDLSHNRLTGVALLPLLAVMQKLKHLVMLDITSVALEPAAMGPLLDGLETASEEIELLIMDVATGRRMLAELKARRKAAVRAGVPGAAEAMGKMPPLGMRPGAACEVGVLSLGNLDYNLVSSTDFLRPSAKLMEAESGVSGPPPEEPPKSGHRQASIAASRRGADVRSYTALTQQVQAALDAEDLSPRKRGDDGGRSGHWRPKSVGPRASSVLRPPALDVDSSLGLPSSTAASPALPWEDAALRTALLREMAELEADELEEDEDAALDSPQREVLRTVIGAKGSALEAALREATARADQSPFSTSALCRLAHARAALSDHRSAAAAFLDAMDGAQEDPAMSAGFRKSLAALRIRRDRTMAEPQRPPPRRSGWGIYDGDQSSEDEAPKQERTTRRRHQKYPATRGPPPVVPSLCDGYERVLRRLWPLFEARAPRVQRAPGSPCRS